MIFYSSKGMARRVAVTGRPGSGKSTVCRKVIEMLSAVGQRPNIDRFTFGESELPFGQRPKVGGMLSADMRRDGRRVGFELMNIMTGEKGILAHIEQDGPRVGKYGVNLGDLDRIGVKAIGDALRADLIVIDEIAPMELRSEGFIMAVSRAMESDKPMLVALHQRSNHELVKRIRSAFDVIEITDENRDEIPNMIIERIRSR